MIDPENSRIDAERQLPSMIDEWMKAKGCAVVEEDRNHLTQQFLSKLIIDDLATAKERIAYENHLQAIKGQIGHQHTLRKMNGGVLPEIPNDLRRQAKLAVALGLDTLDPVLIRAAYDQLEENVNGKELLVEEMKNQLKQKRAELQTILEKRKALKNFRKKFDDTKELRDRETRMTESNLLMLRQKKIEYEHRLKETSAFLKNHVSVHQVDALHAQFLDLQKQRTDLASQLDAFNGLPADRTLARIKVAEAEHELQMLLDKRNRLLKERGH